MNSDAVGTKVSVCLTIRQGSHSSEVVVKGGSTVDQCPSQQIQLNAEMKIT